MADLKDSNIETIRGGEHPLVEGEIQQLLTQIPGWQVILQDGEKRVQKVFKFADFAQALAFTDAVGKLAEEYDHHPALLTEWGKVTVAWWTHKIRGLHRNDFIMAAKTDQAYNRK